MAGMLPKHAVWCAACDYNTLRAPQPCNCGAEQAQAPAFVPAPAYGHAASCGLRQPAVPGNPGTPPQCTCRVGEQIIPAVSKPTVVPLPARNVNDLVGGLRRLADGIERGDFPAIENLGWVMTGPEGIAIGMLGPQASRFFIAGQFMAAAQHALGTLPEL